MGWHWLQRTDDILVYRAQIVGVAMLVACVGWGRMCVCRQLCEVVMGMCIDHRYGHPYMGGTVMGLRCR